MGLRHEALTASAADAPLSNKSRLLLAIQRGVVKVSRKELETPDSTRSFGSVEAGTQQCMVSAWVRRSFE